MDKILEFLIDFMLLALGLTAVFRAGALTESRASFSWELIALLLLVTLASDPYCAALSSSIPTYGAGAGIPFYPEECKGDPLLDAPPNGWRETFAAAIFRLYWEHWAFPLLAGAGMVGEYALMASFLGIHLPFWKTVAAWAAGWMAFLMPLPGGLGALEASQVFVLGQVRNPECSCNQSHPADARS